MSTRLSDKALANALTAMSTAVESGVSIGRLVDDPVIRGTMPVALVGPFSTALAGGATASDAFRRTGLLRRHELAVIDAAERSGHLEQGLAAVAAGIEQRRTDRGVLIASLGYPVMLIVAAGVILPLPLIVTEGVGAYLSRAVWAPLAFVAFVAVFGLWLPRLPASDPRRALPGRLARRLPMLGGALRRADTAAFCRVLAQCVSAGLGMGEALHAASAAVDDPRIRRAGETIARRIERGDRLAEAFQKAGVFPNDAVAMVAQGEITGTLDVVLTRVAEQQGEEGRRAIRRVLLTIVVVVYTAVVLFIGWSIVSGFIGVIDTIDQAVGMPEV